MPQNPVGKHYKSTYWTFECSNNHGHRVDIDFEFIKREWTFELDAWKFLFSEDGEWIGTVQVPVEERIKCGQINHSLYPKTGRFKKNFSKWEWNWIEKTEKVWNLDRNLAVRDRLEEFYKTRSFKCKGLGCRGYGRKKKSWPSWVKPCSFCLQEKTEIKNFTSKNGN